MAKDKFSKGIGNRSAAGSGATWVGAEEPSPRPKGEERAPDLPVGQAPEREPRPAHVHGRARPAPRSNSGLAVQLGSLFAQIGDAVLGAGRFLVREILRPSGRAISKQWQVIREKIGMEDRLIEGDTYDPGRARDWERFKKGKRSSSYLQDDANEK